MSGAHNCHYCGRPIPAHRHFCAGECRDRFWIESRREAVREVERTTPAAVKGERPLTTVGRTRYEEVCIALLRGLGMKFRRGRWR